MQTAGEQKVLKKTDVQSPMKESYLNKWLSSSFPVLCSLLDQIFESEPSVDLIGSNNAANALKEIFGADADKKQTEHDQRNVELVMPLYDCKEKFSSSEDCAKVRKIQALPPHSPVDHEANYVDPRRFPPEFGLAEYHEHLHSSHSGMLQLCSGPKVSVYRTVDNKVREMDAVIKDPGAVLGFRIAETCTLNLPGPYSCARPIRKLKFESNRYTLDVIGLFLLLVDTILAANLVTYVDYKGAVTPLELTHNIVKVVAALKLGFPDIFPELQKLVMYSMVSAVLRKPPFKWNKCMLHVLEDVIIHPLRSFEGSIELQFLSMLLQKRAKTLLTIFSSEEKAFIFNSCKHSNKIQRYFSQPPSDNVSEFLKTSALCCMEGHRVKNIRFEVKDKLVDTYLRDIFVSYSNF